MVWLITNMIDRYFASFGVYVSLEIVKLVAAFTVSYLTLRWALLAGFKDFRVVRARSG